MRPLLRPVEVIGIALAVSALVFVLSMPLQPGEKKSWGLSEKESAVATLLYSTISYTGGVTVTVGEALVLSLGGEGVPGELQEEISSRLDFLFSPGQYLVIFFLTGGESVTFGEPNGGGENILHYTFTGRDLGVVISVEV